jgi:hypothetical protein
MDTLRLLYGDKDHLEDGLVFCLIRPGSLAAEHGIGSGATQET